VSGGSLSFGNAGWLEPVIALLAVGIIAAVVGYRRQPPDRRLRWALGLKLASMALLALALLEPSWTTPHARPGANFFLVLADNSRSLQLFDRGQNQNRGQQLRGMLTGEPAPAWLTSLGETFQLRRYLFDARLRRVPDFDSLAFDGEASHLGVALRTLAERYRGAPLAGILLFSDGNATDLDQKTADTAGLPPIYPVVVGSDAPRSDVVLARLTASQTAFEDAPVTLEAQLDTAGQAGRKLGLELRDDAGTLLETQFVSISASDESATTRFRIRPDKPGLRPYRVTVTGGDQEATTANNSRLVLVERPAGPFRVLYVGGRPNWEYKFLRRAHDGEKLIDLVALVRVARREPKMVFASRQGESSNPLYRGFGDKGEEAERYDEPVLVRLNIREAEELRQGFPRAPELLFGYHAIIIDDLEASFFSADQQALVERFVSERGGGLLMLGGQESFRQGGYERTPIGELLPVYLDRLPVTGVVQPMRFELSREGWLEAWARLRDNESGERARLSAMPAFRVLNRSRALKPGATLLATLSAGSASYPALAAQRAGAGRAAALTVGDLWRWGMRQEPGQDDLGKFWRQTIRWLVSDVPAPVEVRMSPHPAQPGDLTVRAKVRDKAFRPAENATLSLEASGPDGARVPLVAEPSASEPGTYEATYTPRGAGVFRAHLRASAPDGSSLGEAESGVALDLAAEEHRSIRPNRGLLEDLARRTGGAVVRSDALGSFVRGLPERPAPVSDTRTRPLWHSWIGGCRDPAAAGGRHEDGAGDSAGRRRAAGAPRAGGQQRRSRHPAGGGGRGQRRIRPPLPQRRRTLAGGGRARRCPHHRHRPAARRQDARPAAAARGAGRQRGGRRRPAVAGADRPRHLRRPHRPLQPARARRVPRRDGHLAEDQPPPAGDHQRRLGQRALSQGAGGTRSGDRHRHQVRLGEKRHPLRWFSGRGHRRPGRRPGPGSGRVAAGGLPVRGQAGGGLVPARGAARHRTRPAGGQRRRPRNTGCLLSRTGADQAPGRRRRPRRPPRPPAGSDGRAPRAHAPGRSPPAP
jgi:uncharacterized membrane protein